MTSLSGHGFLRKLGTLGREEIRVKVSLYIEKLSSAGHRDVEELTYYGLAYLRDPPRKSRSSLFGLLRSHKRMKRRCLRMGNGLR